MSGQRPLWMDGLLGSLWAVVGWVTDYKLLVLIGGLILGSVFQDACHRALARMSAPTSGGAR